MENVLGPYQLHWIGFDIKVEQLNQMATIAVGGRKLIASHSPPKQFNKADHPSLYVPFSSDIFGDSGASGGFDEGFRCHRMAGNSPKKRGQNKYSLFIIIPYS